MPTRHRRTAGVSACAVILVRLLWSALLVVPVLGLRCESQGAGRPAAAGMTTPPDPRAQVRAAYVAARQADASHDVPYAAHAEDGGFVVEGGLLHARLG